MGLGSWIRDPEKTYSESRIPNPGVKEAPDPGSGSATLLAHHVVFSSDLKVHRIIQHPSTNILSRSFQSRGPTMTIIPSFESFLIPS
jgi:hypothetical protein